VGIGVAFYQNSVSCY